MWWCPTVRGHQDLVLCGGFSDVATIGIRAFKEQAAALVGRAEGGEPIVVSRRGKPVAVLLPLDMDIDEILLANSTALAERRAAALRELARGEVVRGEDLDQAIESSRGRVGRGEPALAEGEWPGLAE
jgi:prevent-host-death family protein